VRIAKSTRRRRGPVFAENRGRTVAAEVKMRPYLGPYADHFVQAILVDTEQEIMAWTTHNPVLGNDDWQIDAYTDSELAPGGDFILAVNTPAGMVGFFAASKADADRIRMSIS
jgi:hypothetical protein